MPHSSSLASLVSQHQQQDQCHHCHNAETILLLPPSFNSIITPIFNCLPLTRTLVTVLLLLYFALLLGVRTPVPIQLRVHLQSSLLPSWVRGWEEVAILIKRPDVIITITFSIVNTEVRRGCDYW